MTHTPGPWIFEPHGGYGDDEGEFPLGYISTTFPMPIFELKPVLAYPLEELTDNARLIAAAPLMLAALKYIRSRFGIHPERSIEVAIEAISQAEGKS